MELDIRFDCTGVDWQVVAETLKCVGMAHFEPDVHRRAFEASHTTVFVYNGSRLIGFGRAISDGVYQAAVVRSNFLKAELEAVRQRTVKGESR